jgi:hypothetical protein
MSRTFVPFDSLENAFRSWWLIVALMVVGGLIGLLVSRARPPLYEATAALSVSIDFTRTGELYDYEEDYVISIAGDVIASSQVREAVAAQTGLSPDALKQQVSFERSYHLWTVRARDASPQQAADLANVWVKQAYAELNSTLEYAMLADRYARQLDLLEGCISQVIASPAQAVCGQQNLSQIQSQIEQISPLEREARVSSRGVLPYTLFALVQPAAVPARPSVFNQGQLVLAGSLVGFLVGLWLAHLRLPSRLFERPLHAG